MASVLSGIDGDLSAWIAQQKLFFVATAPAGVESHVNLSPKGGDAFRVIDGHSVVYADLTGSGAETIAHLRENGRITVLFCAFAGPPRILRLYGRGTPRFPGEAEFSRHAERFPSLPGLRAFIEIAVERVSTSCGFSVPLYDFIAPREALDRWATSKGDEGLRQYRSEKNGRSIDGLPAYPADG